ncbi:hypothetical protein RZS08_00230, partial [Arthrospira platensis SPKY1]|nr:hypothetical protein [Arthrospira platensis SPKY1]
SLLKEDIFTSQTATTLLFYFGSVTLSQRIQALDLGVTGLHGLYHYQPIEGRLSLTTTMGHLGLMLSSRLQLRFRYGLGLQPNGQHYGELSLRYVIP